MSDDDLIDVETVMRVHTKDGDMYEIGSDAEGLEMVELRHPGSGRSVTVPREVWSAMRSYDPDER